MAQNLNKTKRRINSVNSTKKITKAMELVATVKLKRFKDIMFANESYASEIASLMVDLFSQLDEDESKIYLSENNAPKDLIIVVNSNLGLCAGFNNDIYHFVSENVSKETSTIIPIGIKGDNYFSKNGYDINQEFVHLNEHIEYEEVLKLSRLIQSLFLEGKYRSIKMIYTKYVNSLKFTPTLISLFPLAKQEVEVKRVYPPLFDPDIKTLVKELVPIYVASSLYQHIVESQVSEQASRRTAMENATDNADELISQLTLEYNKARQTAITQEITEVVSGQQK